MTAAQIEKANRFKALHQWQIIHGRRAGSGWRQTDQPGHLVVSRGDERFARSGPRVKEMGTFGYLDRLMTTPDLNSLMLG